MVCGIQMVWRERRVAVRRWRRARKRGGWYIHVLWNGGGGRFICQIAFNGVRWSFAIEFMPYLIIASTPQSILRAIRMLVDAMIQCITNALRVQSQMKGRSECWFSSQASSTESCSPCCLPIGWSISWHRKDERLNILRTEPLLSRRRLVHLSGPILLQCMSHHHLVSCFASLDSHR